LLLGYTKVVELGRLPIKPYRSYTFETGFNFDLKKIHGSVFYFNRTMRNGFTTNTQVLPITIPQYSYTLQGGNRPVLYQPTGRDTTIFGNYPLIQNGNYSRTNGLELIVTTDKIRSIETSFNINTSFYSSYYRNSVPGANLGTSGQATIDYTKEALFAVYNNQEAKATALKSTIITNTHIPTLRMVIMLTGEIFWQSKGETLSSSVYPVGYLDRQGAYHELKPGEAQSPAYAHLVKADFTGTVLYTPPMVYSNVHLRLSKEITNVLRLSFNAYNVFNIRPSYRTNTGIDYYNGQPSFGAELTFSIK
ncbi:MAG: TonB-dependent receptor, partial [Sphingobacteriales bacterium]